MYPNVKNFISAVLSLPHSSASAERVFSQVQLIKNEKRNRLINETLNGILGAKSLLANNDCHNWKPSKNLLRSLNV